MASCMGNTPSGVGQLLEDWSGVGLPMELARKDEWRGSESQHRSTAVPLARTRRWMAVLVGISGVAIGVVIFPTLLASKHLIATPLLTATNDVFEHPSAAERRR